MDINVKHLDFTSNKMCFLNKIALPCLLESLTVIWMPDSNIFTFCLNNKLEIVVFKDSENNNETVVSVEIYLWEKQITNDRPECNDNTWEAKTGYKFNLDSFSPTAGTQRNVLLFFPRFTTCFGEEFLELKQQSGPTRWTPFWATDKLVPDPAWSHVHINLKRTSITLSAPLLPLLSGPQPVTCFANSTYKWPSKSRCHLFTKI